MKYKILLTLFIIAFISSVVLSIAPASEVCNLNIGCDVVQNSSYNYIFGIKNSYFGVLIFAAGSLLIFSQIKRPTKKKRNLIHWMVIIGAVISGYFLYVQKFVLGAYCEWCLVIDLGLLLAFVFTLIYWKRL